MIRDLTQINQKNLLLFCLEIFNRLLIKIEAIFNYDVNFFDVYKEIQLRS